MSKAKYYFIIVIGLIGLFITGLGIKQSAFELKPSKSFADTALYQIKNGNKLRGKIDRCAFSYASTTDDVGNTDMYFLIPLPQSVEKYPNDSSKWEYITYKTSSHDQQNALEKMAGGSTASPIAFAGNVVPLGTSFKSYLNAKAADKGLVSGSAPGQISSLCIEYGSEGSGRIFLVVGLIPLTASAVTLAVIYKKNGGKAPSDMQ